jgi:hypothetical protein
MKFMIRLSGDFGYLTEILEFSCKALNRVSPSNPETFIQNSQIVENIGFGRRFYGSRNLYDDAVRLTMSLLDQNTQVRKTQLRCGNLERDLTNSKVHDPGQRETLASNTSHGTFIHKFDALFSHRLRILDRHVKDKRRKLDNEKPEEPPIIPKK